MKTVREDIDTLHASLTITVDKGDYEPKWKEELQKFRKKAQLKGFRKGKVPLSVVKKMYGRSLLAEIINQSLQSELTEFLGKKENKILGQPLPSENQREYDFQEILDEYTFQFDLGLAPAFDLIGVDDETTYEKYVVDISDEEVESHLDEAMEQIGQLVTVEEDIELEDVITIEAIEKETSMDDPFETEFNMSVNRLSDHYKSLILDMKLGDDIEFNIFELEANVDEKFTKKYLLKLEEDQEDLPITPQFKGTIVNVQRKKKAELNQAFFDRYFGPEAISTESEAKDKVREMLENQMNQQVDGLLYREIQEKLTGTQCI